MLSKILFISFIVAQLFSSTYLKEVYYIPTDGIKLSSIIEEKIANDVEILFITEGRYTRRIKAKQLLEILHKYGYDSYLSKNNYVKFIKQSKIDTSKIENSIIQFYKKNYTNININNVTISPRGYIEKLPKNYTVKIKKRNFLKKDGVVSIKSDKNKQLFFNYTIDAFVDIYQTKKRIKRNEELSNHNCKKKSIILNNFRAKPIQDIKKGSLESKRYIKQSTILTIRDVRKLKLATRGSKINVFLNEKNIDISFSAEALDDGVFGETIRVKNHNSRILNVRVIGKNKGKVI